ncbi:MAG: hypothetical protein K6E83_10240 [Clostridium sp.]|nr:hypothetical protein [Clostridium sp.]
MNLDKLKKLFKAAALGAAILCQAGFGPADELQEDRDASVTVNAVYLGVAGYGTAQVNRENMTRFLYRFFIDGEEKELPMVNGTADAAGEYDYPLQNRLKEGYPYILEISGGTVRDVKELDAGEVRMPQLPVRGTPGVRTVRNFLATAMEPVGTTLYMYGGGWDWQDKGSAVQARTIGISPDWVRFFSSQDADYNYKTVVPAESYYPYGGYNEYYYAGLDCSGYAGWVLYNTLNRTDGEEGYVRDSSAFARILQGYGWGSMADPGLQTGVCPGDIVSTDGHVWISLGTCDDGSVVILHSSPSVSRTGHPGGGVRIDAVGFDESCEAYRLADRYMSAFYPEWYSRYPVTLRGPAAYLYCPAGMTGRFIWDVSGGGVLTDPEGIRQMKPEQVLRSLFGE